MNISKRLWHIWIGPKQAPTAWMDTWKKHHSSWDYTLIDNNYIEIKKFHNQKQIEECIERGLYAGAADLIRYETLYEFGGFMPEADSTCLHNTDELWIDDYDSCYTVYENEELRPGFVSPIYAANPKNKFLEIIINELHSLKKIKNKVYLSTGNYFLATMISRYKPKIKIFPSHFFIPIHYTDLNKRYNGSDKIYAEQYWGSTFKDKDVYKLGL